MASRWRLISTRALGAHRAFISEMGIKIVLIFQFENLKIALEGWRHPNQGVAPNITKSLHATAVINAQMKSTHLPISTYIYPCHYSQCTVMVFITEMCILGFFSLCDVYINFIHYRTSKLILFCT